MMVTREAHSTAGSHLLQLYADTPTLQENVVTYLAEGARRGDQLIVIATPEHSRLFTQGLSERDIDVQGLLIDRRLTLLDAEETLSRFMGDGRPDWSRFDATVGRPVRESVARAPDRHTRAYGEMVDVLWSRGKVEAAVELEGFWNELLRQERFGLFCAYAIDLLAPGTSTTALLPVLARHTHLLSARMSGELERAVNGAMRETLGGPAVDALMPLIRATHHARAVPPGPEATLLWLRTHLPDLAEAVVSRSRALYEARTSSTP